LSLNPSAFIVRDQVPIAVRLYPSIEAHLLLPGGQWGYHSSSKATGVNEFKFQLVNGVDRLQAYAPSSNDESFFLLTFANIGESSSSKAVTIKLWNGQAQPPPQLGATATLARQHLVVFGGAQFPPNPCAGPRIEVFPVDQSVPVASGSIPLADRTEATGVAAGDKVFVGLGKALTSCSTIGAALWDGAFFDPSTGVWEPAVTLPDMPSAVTGSNLPLRVLWSGTQIVVIEHLGPTSRVHLLAPGDSAFRTRVVPQPVEMLFFGDNFDPQSEISLASVAVVPLESELLVAAGSPTTFQPGYGDPQLWNPDTGATTHVCESPVIFVDRGTGGRAKNGDIWLLSENGSAQLSLP
jgi:hypothetical protein